MNGKHTNKALFLDRDGVVNVDHGYLYEPEKFEFVDGVFSACKAFVDAGYKLIIVTNQSGIGRGYYTEADFHALSNWVIAQFAEHNITVSGIYFCPHHPNYNGQCNCRKPNPGMILKAKNDLKIDLKQSILVGDKNSDIDAGLNAGIEFQNCHLFKGDFSIIQKEYE